MFYAFLFLHMTNPFIEFYPIFLFINLLNLYISDLVQFSIDKSLDFYCNLWAYFSALQFPQSCILKPAMSAGSWSESTIDVYSNCWIRSTPIHMGLFWATVCWHCDRQNLRSRAFCMNISGPPQNCASDERFGDWIMVNSDRRMNVRYVPLGSMNAWLECKINLLSF